MGRTLRSNFTDRQRANIFARDRAMCCYTGMSLWLLDYGAAPTIVDQVDHVVPASKGGTNDESNGVLCNFLHNYLRGNEQYRIPLFDEGLPNKDAFWVFGAIPGPIMAHIQRFETLHHSDWFLNRAIAQFRMAAAQIDAPTRVDGKPFKRGLVYCCTAMLKRLTEWRASAQRDGVPSLAERGLLPDQQGPDHMILLDALKLSSAQEIAAAAARFAPYLSASHRAVDAMFDVNSEGPLRNHLKQVLADPFVVARTKRAIGDYLSLMLPATPPARTQAG